MNDQLEYYSPSLKDFNLVIPLEWSRLMIFGYPGTGKTTLGGLLTAECDVLTIDTSGLYQRADIQKAILNHLGTQNVLGLLRGQRKPKAIVFDDVDAYHAYDKKSLEHICKYFADTHDKRKMVMLCNPSLSKNRQLQKIPAKRLTIRYTSEHYTQCVRAILRANGIRATKKRIDLLSEMSNFHRMYEAIGGYRRTGYFQGDTRDHRDLEMEMVYRVLKCSGVKDILRCIGSDHALLGLTLLDRSPAILSPGYSYAQNMGRIYRDATQADIVETRMNMDHMWELHELSGILSVHSVISVLAMDPMTDLMAETFPYNRYLSRCISIVHNRNVLRALDYSLENIIHVIFRTYQDKIGPEDKVIDYVQCLPAKEFRLICQAYQVIYNQNVTAKRLRKDLLALVNASV